MLQIYFSTNISIKMEFLNFDADFEKKLMKKILSLALISIFTLGLNGQTKTEKKAVTKTAAKKATVKKTVALKPNADLSKINDSVTALIPQKKDKVFGFINQKGKVIVPHQYSNVGFFAEDCKLLASPNEKVRKYGSKDYASVRLNGVDYRMDMAGKRVYKFKDEDLGKCPSEFKKQLYNSYVRQGWYGIIDPTKFENEMDYRHYVIYPQYQYLHIMEGDDFSNPMIIAAVDNRFGVIDINNKIIVPFEYDDIKPNFSWKLARLFEVTKDGKNYFYIDDKNKRY